MGSQHQKEIYVTREVGGLIKNMVKLLLSGHPQAFEHWPLNGGWPFNIGKEYSNTEEK